MPRGTKKTPLEAEVPCALQGYLQTLDVSADFKDLSSAAREYAFQHWIAFVRCRSAVFTSENLRCPLLGCNQDLDSLPVYLQHITSCPQLKNPYYWCPLHQQAETVVLDKTHPKRSLRDCFGSKVSKAASCIRKATQTLAPHRLKRSCRSFSYRMEATASELEDSWIYPVSNRTIYDPFPPELSNPDLFYSELPNDLFHTELPNPDWFYPELPSPDSSHPEPPSPESFIPPNPQVPALNPTRCALSATSPLRTAVEPPFSPIADIKQRQLSDIGNIKPTVNGIPGTYPTRRSEPPRLSVVTRQNLRSEYCHSSQAISSLSNSETRETIKQDTPSLAHVDARLQTVPGASSYSTGSSSVQSSLFDGVISDGKLLLVERDDPVSPSSASTGLDPQLFDASIFRSPKSHKENIHPAQKTSKPLTIAFGQTPVVTHPSSLSHHPGVPSEGDISLVCNNYQPIPNTRMSSDTAASSSIPRAEQLVQHVITRVTRVHRHCTSTCNPGTDRTIRVFGPDGYSAYERGVQVLRRMYKGIIPRSADAICAFLQVTLQFLSCVQSRGNDNWWSLSRDDLDLWSSAIQDKAEQDLFTGAINILWVSWKCLQRRRPCASPHRTAHASSSHTSPSAADKVEQSSRLAGGPVSGRSSLDQALRDSAVIRICSRFLDEFEWLDLNDRRNSLIPPSPPDRVSRAAENLKFMRDNLIQPLLRHDQFSSFHQDVLMVEEQLARGFLYTVREIEVTLMHHVLQRNVAKETLDEFSQSVRVHCDKALSPDSETCRSCRTRQYRTDLTQMKAISSEQKERASRKPMEQIAGKMWDHTESYRKGSTDDPIQPSLGGFVEARPRDAPPLTCASIENGAIRDISTTTLSRRSILTPVLASSYSPEAYSTIFGGAGQRTPYCGSTPATSVTESAHATPTSHQRGFEEPTAPTVDARCPTCDSLFTGDDRHANLKRHQRTAHNPQPIPCSFEDCLAKFTRSDNRLKHHREQHGLGVQGRAKKHKGSRKTSITASVSSTSPT